MPDHDRETNVCPECKTKLAPDGGTGVSIAVSATVRADGLQ